MIGGIFRFIAIVGILVAVVVFAPKFACGKQEINSVVAENATVQKVHTYVKRMVKLGFYCRLCDMRILRDVRNLPGVKSVRLTSNHVLIIVGDGVNIGAVRQIIERENYRFV